GRILATPSAHGPPAPVCHETVNERPSAEKPAGTAPAWGWPRSRRKIVPSSCDGTSEIGIAAHAASASVPGWPSPATAIREKVTEPKFASGSGLQTPSRLHSAGASTIHSEEVRSGAASVRRRVALVRRVQFLIWMSTLVPSTLTEAVIVSPGVTFNFRF